MKTRNSKILGFFVVVLFLALAINPVVAQTPEAPLYRLNINRDFGYGNGAEIKGLFSLKVIGPEDLKEVSFFIDGELMSTAKEEPYKFQFNTSQYPFGWHDLTARVTNTAGEVYDTPARHMNFVSAEQEAAGTQKVMLPILLVVVVIVVIISLAQFLMFRKRNPNGVTPGTQRNYGYAGGTICRNCGRPTPRHIWGFNIGIGKFDRCENCGKWSVMQAAPYDILRAAEIAEKAEASEKPTFNEKSDEEKLRDLIDKSKYE